MAGLTGQTGAGRQVTLAWVLVLGAVGADVLGAILLREANGFERPWLLGTAYLLWVLAIGLLGAALRGLALSVGYPVFIGLTSVGVYLCARFGYGESMPVWSVLGLALVILGAVLVSES